MSGRIVYVPAPNNSHRCDPSTWWVHSTGRWRKPVVGTVWRCGDCGLYWEWNWHTPNAWEGRSGEWVTSLGSWFELPKDYGPPAPPLPEPSVTPEIAP